METLSTPEVSSSLIFLIAPSILLSEVRGKLSSNCNGSVIAKETEKVSEDLIKGDDSEELGIIVSFYNDWCSNKIEQALSLAETLSSKGYRTVLVAFPLQPHGTLNYCELSRLKEKIVSLECDSDCSVVRVSDHKYPWKSALKRL